MIYSRQGSVNGSVACLTFKKVRKKKEVGSFICGLFNDSLSSSNYRVDGRRNVHKALSCVPATSVHARFPPTADKMYVSGGCPASQRVASERAKRTLWLVAENKLVCSLLPGRSCGPQR